MPVEFYTARELWAELFAVANNSGIGGNNTPFIKSVKKPGVTYKTVDITAGPIQGKFARLDTIEVSAPEITYYTVNDFLKVIGDFFRDNPQVGDLLTPIPKGGDMAIGDLQIKEMAPLRIKGDGNGNTPVAATLNTPDVKDIKATVNTPDLKDIKATVNTPDLKAIQATVKTPDTLPVKAQVGNPSGEAFRAEVGGLVRAEVGGSVSAAVAASVTAPVKLDVSVARLDAGLGEVGLRNTTIKFKLLFDWLTILKIEVGP